jgi:N-acetylmuramoyl-L-alanine amidase
MRDRIVERRRLCGVLAGAALAASPFGAGLARSAGSRKRQPPRLPAIAIDAGHGGSDPGAISPHRIYEKNITLAIAVELARQLAATRRFRPLLIRRGDEFISLHDRVARARAWRAELFLSLHADALPDPAKRGALVFTLSDEASDRQAAWFARNENQADTLVGLDRRRQSRDVDAILVDLVRRQTGNRSLELARLLVDALGREVALFDKPQRSAGFAVLTAPDIPSALVELGCLSNAEEERLLQQRLYQHHLAHALLRAIADFWAAGPTV